MTLHEKIAIFLITLSWVIFAGVFVLPFVIVGHDKLLVAGVTYVFSQVVFWTGCAIGGRAVMHRYQVIALIKKWLQGNSRV